MNSKNHIIPIITIAAIILLFLFFLVGIRYNRGSTVSVYDDASYDLSENVTVELKEYFGRYLTSQKGEIRELTNTVDSLQRAGGYIELTQEQQDGLIRQLTAKLTPDLLRTVTGNDTAVAKETIEDLEQTIYDRICEDLGTYEESAEPTDSQKEAMADAVTVIVESNIMAIVDERFEQQNKYLDFIEESIAEKLQKMTDTVNHYQETVKEIENKLRVLEKNSSNSEEVEKLRAQLEILRQSYESFIATAQPAIHIVTDLSVYPAGSNDVLSARAGYSLSQRLSNVNTALSTSFNEFSEYIDAKVDDNYDKQSQKLADAKTDLESQIADNVEQLELLDKARQAAQKALETKEAEDVEAFKKALQELDTNLSSDLQEAYDSLLTDLDKTRDSLQDEIRQMGDDVNNNIVAKLPVYEWSEDGEKLTIIIPAQ